MSAHKIRVLGDSKNKGRRVIDSNSLAPLFWWRGSDLKIEFALAQNGEFVEPGDVGTIYVAVKDSAAGPDDTPRMLATLTSADVESGFTASDWASGSNFLGAAEFTREQAALEPGKYVLILVHIDAAGERNTHLLSEVEVKEDQHDSVVLAAPLPLTVSEQVTALLDSIEETGDLVAAAEASAAAAADAADQAHQTLLESSGIGRATNVFTIDDVIDAGEITVTINGFGIGFNDSPVTPAEAAFTLRDLINAASGATLVTAEVFDSRKVRITATAPGEAGNGIACTESSDNGSWESASTNGGAAGAFVGTFSQTLTESEKRQARENIGAGASIILEAVGDGVTDDTAALQSALDQLESGSADRLIIPKGKYRLNSLTANSQTSTAANVLLTFGTTAGADDRDFEIIGEPGAVLYSTSSPTRAHFILANARFRSLSIKGLRFEKDSTPLASNGTEPNGCDALALVRYDRREVEKVTLENCVFFNCHGPCRNYLPYGNEVRGKLKTFNFLKNEVLNPYGSNTDGAAWGGGQGLNLGPWVQTCRVIGNRFQGCADVVDPATNPGTGDVTWPGGVPKDAAFFGQPIKLIFQQNTVENFGIETVFQLPDENLLGYREITNLTVPPDDDSTTVDFQIKDGADSTFEPGMVVTLANSASGVGDVQLIVTGWDSGTRTVTAKNSGHANNPAPGSALTGQERVFHDVPNNQSAVITDNVFTHSQPAGLRGLTTQGMAIVISCQSVVANNSISDYATAIRCYHPVIVFEDEAAADSIISGNSIHMIDRAIYTGDNVNTNNAIYMETGGALIEGNMITSRAGLRQHGIRLLSGNNIVRGNIITSFENQTNSGADRGAAISEVNTATGNVLSGNITQGWDAGVASSGFTGFGSAAIESHISKNDAVDFFNMANAPIEGGLIGYGAGGALETKSGETQTVRLGADEVSDNTTTINPSPTLLVPLLASTSYTFKLWIRYTTLHATARGMVSRFVIPSGSTVRGSYNLTQDGSAVLLGELISNTSATLTTTKSVSTGSTDDCTICIEGTIKTSITAGDFVFNWGQQSAGAASEETKIKSGSFLTVSRIID